MKRKRIINKICNHAEYFSWFDSLDNLMPDMEQFMRNENKMMLNEPTATIEARTLITICIQVLRQVSTIADRMFPHGKDIFHLTATQVYTSIILKRVRGAIFSLLTSW